MTGKSILTMASALTALSLLLVSCAPAVAPTPTAAQKPAPTAAPAAKEATPAAKPAPTPAAPAATTKPAAESAGGGKAGGILNIGHFGDPVSLDPIQEASVRSLSPVIPSYSGIVQHDPLTPAKVIGDLAEKWDVSTDGLTYAFHLVKNVKWHDGTPFTAEDARFTLEVVRKPPRGVVSTRSEWLKAVDKIEAPDANTLKMTLQFPSASFIHNLGDGRMVIVPKHVFEAKGNMKRDVVGTGPYKFKSFAAGTSYSVVKNPDYFVKGRPHLDGITWYTMTDVATRFAALRTKRVVVTPWGSQGLTPSQSEIIRKDLSDKIAVDNYPSLAFNSFRMVQTKAPWNDVRVRRAIDMAIDRPKVIKVAVEGAGAVGGFVPPGEWSLPQEDLMKLPGYRQPKDADIAEAKRLLAEAGYPQGIKTTTVTGDTKEYERSAVGLKEQLAQIGIDITVRVLDQGTLFDLLYKRNFDTTAYGGTAAFDDPDQIFGQNFVSGVTRNFADFSDERVDKWYDEQSRTLDPAKRKQIVLDMQRRMFELSAASMLYWKLFELGRWKDVKDFKAGIGVYNNLKFQDVWLQK